MNNWNTILDKAMDVANIAGRVTGEVVETSKLKLQCMSINGDIQKCYEKIGSLIYRTKMEGQDNTSEIEDYIAEAEGLLNLLKTVEAEISEIRKVRRCSNCGANCTTDSHFCSRCGMIMDRQEPSTPPAPTEAEAAPEAEAPQHNPETPDDN